MQFSQSPLRSVAPSNLLRSNAVVSSFPKRLLWFCPAHTWDTSRISKRNAFADVAAKAAARQPVVKIMTVVSDKGSWLNLRKLYQWDVKNEEKQEWRKWEAMEDDVVIWTTGRKPVLPEKYLMTVTNGFHDKAYGGVAAVANEIQQLCVALSICAATKRIINGCSTCQKFSNIKLVHELGRWQWAFFFSKECKWIMLICPEYVDINIC